MNNDSQARFEKLEVYQEAKEFAKASYKLLDKFPSEEKYGLADQIRRSANSVILNIAEGSSKGRKEFQRFLQIAVGSANETIAGFDMAKEVQYISQEEFEAARNSGLTLARRLQALSKSLTI
jgi:four helix bundle protein